MSSLESMVIAVDGEAKCGKTTVITAIADEAEFQAGIIPDLLREEDSNPYAGIVPRLSGLKALQEAYSFNNITAISAGNFFRAATQLVIEQENKGVNKSYFDKKDLAAVIGILSSDGAVDFLQTDVGIESRVGKVGKLVGVQALCGSAFVHALTNAYHNDGGGNLVIVDARQPLEWLKRNDALGQGAGEVKPSTIMPIYIDTPAEVAARRMLGDFNANLERIESRRFEDATRDEYPVEKPTEFIESDLIRWFKQFIVHERTVEELALPFKLVNDEDLSLSNIKYFASLVATGAQDAAMHLHAQSHNR